MSSVAVSVLVPCYNAGEFLADALQSVREQTLHDFECIIIDDASTDDSTRVARRFAKADPRFRLFGLPENRGVSAARNRGLSEAQGRWIAVLDADDLYLPDRLQHLSELGERLRADIVVDEQLIANFPSRAPLFRAFRFKDPHGELKQEEFFRRSRMFRVTLPLGYMKPLMLRDFVNQSGLRYDESVSCGEDFLIYATLFASDIRCFTTNYAGYLYRRRAGSVSRTAEHLELQKQLIHRVLAEQQGRLSEASRAALLRFSGDFDDVIGAMPAISAVHARDWPGLAAALLRQPSALRTAARLTRRRIIRKLSPLLR